MTIPGREAEVDVEVVIVGGGPVGMALAIDLGQRGITCVVIERRERVGTIPKGQSLMHRSLEHFYFWGCLEELRAARVLPPGYPIGGITAYGSLSSRYWYLPEGLDVVDQFFFQKNERLPQYRTEEVLRARAGKVSTITINYATTVTDVDQHADYAKVVFESSDDPTDIGELRARFVVGCDGARSLVRECAGIERRTRDFSQKMVLAVFRSTELHAGLERFPERTTYRVLNPKYHGIWQFFGRVKLGESWFFHGPVPDDMRVSDTETLQSMLEEAAGFQFACEFEHIGLWDLKIEVAQRYRNRRVFIAGDASHVHPPYGGLGLNTGFDDIANLGWKLAANLQGWGGEQLLESYSQERHPIFAETGDDVIGRWIDDDAEFFSRYDPNVNEPAFEKAWNSRTGGEFAPPWYEPRYDGSSVIVGATSKDIGIHGEHTFLAQPGHHLAPCRLSSSRDVYEELGHNLTLLAFGADNAEVETIVMQADRLGIPLRVVRDDLGEDRDRYGASLILVRPDQYVAWSANHAPDHPNEMLARVCGRETR
ncbi:MAG TPA: FAD-dependent monooxygenase [Acidimicrobiales bacterium]|nr:FAD-dependent monooxygenase [Acidimicrobiales bacterium]